MIWLLFLILTILVPHYVGVYVGQKTHACPEIDKDVRRDLRKIKKSLSKVKGKLNVK